MEHRYVGDSPVSQHAWPSLCTLNTTKEESLLIQRFLVRFRAQSDTVVMDSDDPSPGVVHNFPNAVDI